MYFIKKKSYLIDEYFWEITQKVNLIFNIEATIRTNSITPRNLVIPACFHVKFMITYSKFHRCFSIKCFFLLTSR